MGMDPKVSVLEPRIFPQHAWPGPLVAEETKTVLGLGPGPSWQPKEIQGLQREASHGANEELRVPMTQSWELLSRWTVLGLFSSPKAGGGRKLSLWAPEIVGRHLRPRRTEML